MFGSVICLAVAMQNKPRYMNIVNKIKYNFQVRPKNEQKQIQIREMILLNQNAREDFKKLKRRNIKKDKNNFLRYAKKFICLEIRTEQIQRNKLWIKKTK